MTTTDEPPLVQYTGRTHIVDELVDVPLFDLTPGYQLAEREWTITTAALDGTAGDSIADRMRDEEEQ